MSQDVTEHHKHHILNVAEAVRGWIAESQGTFQIQDIVRELGLDRENYRAVQMGVMRLLGPGVLERVGEKHGVYRRVETDIGPMEFAKLDDTPLNIQFPLRVHEWVKTMPKNLIVIAGEPNAGKTAFLLAFTEINMKNHTMRYLSSEMGPLELKTRLKEFATPLSEWPPIFFERTSNFEDLILPEGITVVDYLEVSDEFYRVGGMLTSIFNKLTTGIAIVAIQKNPGTDYGVGGARGLEKPRLYLSMKSGELKITKGKNWMKETNPSGLAIGYKLVRGARFIEDPGGWRRV